MKYFASYNIDTLVYSALVVDVDEDGSVLENFGTSSYDEITEQQYQDMSNAYWTWMHSATGPVRHTDNELSELRKHKKKEIILQIALRVEAVEPDLYNEDVIRFMALIWPMLDETQAPATILQAKDIYQYGKSRLTALDTATKAQIEAYDPATDPNWPA